MRRGKGITSGSGHGNQNQAKTSSTISHGHDDLPLLPPRPLHLYHLPHDALFSYLTTRDVHVLMESSHWLLKVYGGMVKEIKIAYIYSLRTMAVPIDLILLSIMKRRPNLTSIRALEGHIEVVTIAMRKGYLNNLQSLYLQAEMPLEEEVESEIESLEEALADGLCPNLHTLTINVRDTIPAFVLPVLADGLQSRSEAGKACRQLKCLEVKGNLSSLPWLLTPTCGALEELKLDDTLLANKAKDDLWYWLKRTKATHLRAFILTPSFTNDDIMEALCFRGVAPRLQVLKLVIQDPLLGQYSVPGYGARSVAGPHRACDRFRHQVLVLAGE